MSIQLVSTATISLFDLAQLLTESYQGYYVPLRMTEEQLHHHVVHYNIDLERSAPCPARWATRRARVFGHAGTTRLDWWVRGDRAATTTGNCLSNHV
ncbi:MAG UNVERIFIED_CONTAM: hypothetical protein LVT10_26590 [Anaerolineae bacterium]